MRLFNWLIGRKNASSSEHSLQRLDEEKLQASLSLLVKHSEFRRIFEQLVREGHSRSLRSLTVLSLENQEGKTLLVSLLAFACAELLRERVLILDAQTNVRPGSLRLESIFEPDESTRRPNGVCGTFQLNIDLLKISDLQVKTSVDIAYHVDALIDSLGESYDTILIDTGSMNGSVAFDPIVLANRSGAALLVASSRSVGSSAMTEFKDKTPLADRRLLGVVMNDGRM